MSTELQAHTQRRAEDPQLSLTGRREGVHIESVSHTYRDRYGEALQVLLAVTLELAAGQTLAIVGPSGCGKSTMLELICALQRPAQGRIDTAPAVLMPQRDLLLPWLSALDNAALALRISGSSRADARRQAQPLFDELGLAGFEGAMPHELSGGMRQRVAFLRTLLSGKPVLCLDEPFGALDAITRLQMQEWLARALCSEPRTVVLVTHDVEEAILLADRVAVLSPRPGRVLCTLEVELPRPRIRTEQAFHELRTQILGALGVAQASPTRSAGGSEDRA